MDVERLQEILRKELVAMKDTITHSAIPGLCENLGIPIPDSEMSKRDRLDWAARNTIDVPLAASRFLVQCTPGPAVRNSIEDILWADTHCPDISKRCRREVARAIDSVGLYIKAKGFDALLESLWDLGTDPWSTIFGRPSGLRAEIQRHVHEHPEDWDAETLFEKLGALDAPTRRFAYFLEGLASADVRPDESSQRNFVTVVNVVLHQHGIELRETGSEDGYPIFSIVEMHSGVRGRPKNLIFASSSKPDLRLKDAISNDIEILSDPTEVLVYDRAIGTGGLTWTDLQNWWSETEGILDSVVAKKSLYKRLLSSLPTSSPPQALLFQGFFETFAKEIPRLPALLPEVWLHWDPYTVKQRGPDALFRFRMDFLLLMPHNVRIVLEVDGKHHYADQGGRADAGLYAKTMAADRDLKLAGYEVFRFGAAELLEPGAKLMVRDFFLALIKRYGGLG